jgi:hypothetical protein
VQKESVAFSRHQATDTQAGFADPVDPQRLLQPNTKAPAQVTSRTKQVVVIKAAICQQDHRTSFGKNGSRLFQDLLVSLQGHHRALLLQNNPTQWQCSTTIDQCNTHNHKLIPQAAAIQRKVNLVAPPVSKDVFDQLRINRGKKIV